jgi:phage N-6-adenine-methyltransferase
MLKNGWVTQDGAAIGDKMLSSKLIELLNVASSSNPEEAKKRLLEATDLLEKNGFTWKDAFVKNLKLRIHFSKKNDSWGTPIELFNELNSIFNFSLDCAATKKDTLCKKFVSKEMGENWDAKQESALYINPPYSPSKICYKLVEKVANESLKHNIPAVALVPSRTETKLWQEVIFPKSTIIFNFKGRLKFQGAKDFAPFPSSLAIFNPTKQQIDEFKKKFGNKGTCISIME